MKVNTTKNVEKRFQKDIGTEKIGQKIGKEPRQEVFIPIIAGGSDVIECCLNGYCYVIRRGERVLLPKPIVKLLENSGVL